MDEHSKPDAALLARLHHFFQQSDRTRSTVCLLEQRLKSAGVTACLFGGFLRDVMIFETKARPRDIDLVVEANNLDVLTSVFADHIIRSTRFGGLQLDCNGVRVDVWPLSETWAFRSHLVWPPSFSQLPKTTFLNVEAVALRLDRCTGPYGPVYTHTFFEAIDQRCIDINLESNPFPELCVVRSLITAVRLDYRISRRLAKYIYTHARGASAEGLEAVQISHYGTVKCRGADLLRWASDVGRQLQTKVGEVRILVSKERTRQIRDNADLCMLE